MLLPAAALLYGQATYYWTGGAGPVSFSSNSNWNTALNGSGTTRSAADNTDILIFDGSNIGGTAPATGTVTATVTSTTAGQLKLLNNATLVLTRTGTGTGALTISGSGTGDDLVVESGSSLSLSSATANGNVQMVMGTGATGRISGIFNIVNTGQQRISNGTSGIAGSLVFTNGSSCTTNVTSSSSSYPFGNNSQSSEKWVVFESGASLYYEGGWSPMGNNSAFAAIDFKPGSNWYHRATNAIPSVFGSFFNAKSFGNIIVENNATLGSDGPIYRIGNLTINAGSAFTTHSSGQTVVLGNMTVNGSFGVPSGSSNVLVLGGNTPQTVSGSGTITIPGLVVADQSDVTLNKNITVSSSTNIYGKINFATSQLSGAGTFTARVNNTATGVTGTLAANSYQITGVVGTLANLNGLSVTGTGIAPNTNVVGFSSGGATINLSKPIVTSGTGVALSFTSDTATLATAHPSGMDSLNGSVIVVGAKTFQSGTNYIIDAATTWPFGVSSGSSNTYINAGFVEVNAPITVNRGISVYDHLGVNGRITLRPLDTVHVMNGAVINGAFSASNYIVTAGNTSTGVLSVVQYDGLTTAVTIPIGSSSYYLPVTLDAAAASDFVVNVFEGITSNGLITGTALTPSQKQNVVNAVWNISRLGGTGNSNIQFGWNTALEGSTFTTLPNSDIGIIANTGAAWALPVGTGNNTANTATASVTGFGAFSIGAVPQVQPFVFNVLPVKVYGAPDFNGGATSLNTTQPISYASNNPAVATIAGGNIHITGAGTATITASQASDGFYPAASVARTLTVDKAPLTITANNQTKVEGEALPVFTVSYSGFVNSETPAVLLTPAVATTAATAASPAGTYSITVSGATAANYTITHVNGVLTVNPRLTPVITFNALPVKTYGNGDFAAGATSTNTAVPVTYASSNPGVATVTGSTIHISGAGTTTITASQAGNVAYFPAANVSQVLTVNKAPLTIRVRDTSKVEGSINPQFTITYTGFVLGETAASLTAQPVAATAATTNSMAGYYTVTPEGAVASNYNITYIAGRLTINPPGSTDEAYLNAYLSNSTTLVVRVYVAEAALGDIFLYDRSGKLILRRNAFLPKGFISVNLDVSTIASGVYALAVKGPGVDLSRMISIIK
ncbi:MAG: MBG domain-containing protein [Chitinophagaceae bacterium]